jgi:epoxide hydrolase
MSDVEQPGRVRRRRRGGDDLGPITVPTGVSIFPREIRRPSRRWAESRFVNLHSWNELDRGGHFAAFEQRQLFVDEVRAAFRDLR